MCGYGGKHHRENQNNVERAETLGNALRLAYTLSGAAPGLLPMTKLELVDQELILNLYGDERKDREIFTSEAVERRLDILARTIGRRGRIS